MQSEGEYSSNGVMLRVVNPAVPVRLTNLQYDLDSLVRDIVQAMMRASL